MPTQHREKTPQPERKSHHKPKIITPDLSDITLNSSESELVANPNKIKSGLTLKKVYNVEALEIDRPNSAKKLKKEKSKINDSKIQKKSELLNRDREKSKNKNQEKALQKKNQYKLTQKKSKEKVIKLKKNDSDKSTVSLKRRKDSPKAITCDHDEYVENRLSYKIWHIMNRDSKFDRMHASDSETKKHIISVIKKYNAKELKHFNRPRQTQTSQESISSGNKSNPIKRRVRKQLWYLAKNAIKNNAHWSTFLAENNIIVDNINIDKFDLSLIDIDALGIENKLLKRTIVWLFK